MAAIDADLRVFHGAARVSAQPREAARGQIRQVIHVGCELCGILQPAADRQSLGGTRRREVDPGSLVAESPVGAPDCRTDLELAGAGAAKDHNALISGLATIMRILDRYIARRVFRGYALILVILVSAFSLIALVRELDSVGKGTYKASDAALYVLLTLPGWMVALAPAMTLLGAIVGLGELAAGAELIVMQALSVSRARIAWSVLKTGLVVMLAVVGVQEFAAPKLNQLAFDLRTQAISSSESTSTRRGFWSRNGLRVVHVRSLLHGRIPSEIEIYQFDNNGGLRFVAWAKEAVIQDSKRWVLHDVRQQFILKNKILTERFARLPWDSPFTPEEITNIMLPVEMLSPSELYGYVQYLKRAGLAAERPELTLWQSISMPLSTLAMVILAIPYVLGPIRQVSAGKRMLHGGLIGTSFHAGRQLTIQLGSLFHLSAPLVTLSPVAVMLGVAVWLYRRK